MINLCGFGMIYVASNVLKATHTLGAFICMNEVNIFCTFLHYTLPTPFMYCKWHETT